MSNQILMRAARFLAPAGVFEITRARRVLQRIAPHVRNPWRAALSGRMRQLLNSSRLAYVPAELLQRPECVVDIGAHHGVWSEAILELVRPRHLIAVEPTPESFARLKARVGDRANVKLFCCAIGAKAGTASLNIIGSSDFNSLLPVANAIKDHYPQHLETQQSISVEVMPLDQLLKDAGEITLLKVDVQGAEFPLLDGARATLERTAIVLLEVNFVSHYVGDTLFEGLHERMTKEFGFALANVAPPYYRRDEQAMWTDAVYVRRR